MLQNKSSNILRILMIGDVVGKLGRKTVAKLLPRLKQEYEIDFVILNAENIAGGFGITEKTYLEMNAIGVDVFTMGNHWKDKPDIYKLRQKYQNVVLPHNLPDVPGVEIIPSFFCASKQKTIHVVNLMGTFAMKEKYGNPFTFLLNQKEDFAQKVKTNGDIFIADIHAEGNSEKQSIAWLCDGVFAAVVGTHTHVPTADERILNNGTAYISDIGMTGAYDSVTGMNKERIIKRLSFPEIKCALEVSEQEPWFCGFMVDVDLTTSLAKQCVRLQCRLNQDFSEESWIVNCVNAGNTSRNTSA